MDLASDEACSVLLKCFIITLQIIVFLNIWVLSIKQRLHCIPYGAYISWAFNFANFESFVKFISAKILTAMVRYMSSTCIHEIISMNFF